MGIVAHLTHLVAITLRVSVLLTNDVVNIATHATVKEEREFKVLPGNTVVQAESKVRVRIANILTVRFCNLALSYAFIYAICCICGA